MLRRVLEKVEPTDTPVYRPSYKQTSEYTRNTVDDIGRHRFYNFGGIARVSHFSTPWPGMDRLCVLGNDVPNTPPTSDASRGGKLLHYQR